MGEASENPGMVLTNDAWCFVCGQDNPIGLRLRWRLDPDGLARAEFRPGRQHQGWRGVVHGGILASLLDEAMAQRLRFSGAHAVTASLTVRYRRPAPTSGLLIAEARLVAERSRAYVLEACVRGEDGAPYAEGKGTCVRVTHPRKTGS